MSIEKYKDRCKSFIVVWLAKRSNTDKEIIASYLNCSVHYLNNKLNRNSFSYEDLIKIAHACKHEIVFRDVNDSDFEYTPSIDEIFGEEEYQRIKQLDKEREDKEWIERHERYCELRAEVQRMKEEYGFSD